MDDTYALYRDGIVGDPNILFGKPTVRGTRIAVEHVLEQLVDCPDTAELFAVFLELSREDVQACLAYAQALTAGETVTPAPEPHRSRRSAARPRA